MIANSHQERLEALVTDRHMMIINAQAAKYYIFVGMKNQVSGLSK